ncbi:ammonia-forming cytochrome c nitrite reductase subunit c552 [Brevibacillus sp. SYSU BS000544]|uniref:ammonia-forming cytochrome c nitrite reductase subunit c552 n=1 Tax=Brevibacillus sp. SYSU BS000544 TaxID=3416443 RepID=UPI003CE52A8F
MKMRHKWLAVLALVFGLGLALTGCGGDQTASAPPIQTNIPDGEPDSEVWGKEFPLQYQSYMENNDDKIETKFAGSKPVPKVDQQPLLNELFKGMAFAKEYNEDRGHTFAIEDVTHIKRIDEKSPSSCWNCKSPDVPLLVEKEGVAFFKVPFSKRKDQITHSIGCANCHDAKTLELKVTNKNFIDSAARLNIDLKHATKQEMRTYVCAQCHNEYYFKPDTKEVVNPWDKGKNPEEIVSYYNEKGFKDWVHPDSKTPMIKAQHPDYEMFSSGMHGQNGVSCADCHMPYQRDGDKKKFSSHHWQSPIKTPETIEASCRTCHREKSTDELKDRVLYTQVKTYDMLLKAQQATHDAHQAVKKALENPAHNKDMIKKAQDLIRKAQFEWDFVSAESSMGFHNPQLALESLGKSIDDARQAQLLAVQAISAPVAMK